MLFQSSLVLLAITSVQATAVLVQRAPELESRAVSQGWSLQSSSAPSSLHSCGNGAYCPISLHCNSMVNNHQVAACCTSANDCRGEVSAAPICADPSWNLWVGYDGNGFCCEEGLVGVYDISKSVAGVCVASGNKGSLRDAVLTSTGTGAAATSAPESGSGPSTTVPAGTTSGTSGSSSTAVSTSASPSSTSPASSSSTVAPSSTSGSTSGATSGSTGASAANATSSAAPAGTGAADTPGTGVKTTAGFSLMAVAFVVVAML